jgi:hypothetical protein
MPRWTASRLTTIHREPSSEQSPQVQIRRIGKSANQAATDLGSNPISKTDPVQSRRERHSARQY